MSSIIFIILGILIIGCTKREAGSGDTLNPIYGIAYYRFDLQVGVCYPVPFNIPIHLLHRFWWWIRSPKFIMDKISEDIKNAERKEQ